MTIKELIDLNLFQVINEGNNIEQKISKPYCCDLLSIAMSSAPADGIWFTVMGNINTLAVAELTEISCIVLSHNATFDAVALEKAKKEGITVLSTDLPSFDAAILVYKKLNR